MRSKKLPRPISANAVANIAPMSAPVKAIPDFGVTGDAVAPLLGDAGAAAPLDGVLVVVEPLDVAVVVVVVVVGGTVVVVVGGTVVVVVGGSVVVVVVVGGTVVVVVGGSVVVVVVVGGTVVVVVVGSVVVVVVVVVVVAPSVQPETTRFELSVPCVAVADWSTSPWGVSTTKCTEPPPC
jgi:hypothetical protein